MEGLNLLQSPEPSPPSDEPENNSLSKTGILIGLVIAYLAIIVTGFLLPNPLGLNWGIIATFICIGHFYKSFDQINAGEHVIILYFGRIIFCTSEDVSEEGWVLVPYPFFKIERITRGTITGEFGSPFTKRVSENSVEEIEEEKSDLINRQPFRPTFLDVESIIAKGELDQRKYPDHLWLPDIAHMVKENSELLAKLKKEPAHSPITPELKLFFTFRVRNMNYFYRNVPGDSVQEKLSNLASLITDQCKATVSETAGLITFGFFWTNQEIVNGRLRLRVEILIGERESFSEDPEERAYQEKNYPYLGVDLNNLRLKDPGLPLHVNVALSQTTAAGYERQRAIIASEGKKIAAINEGEGAAAARKAILFADADGKKAGLLAEAEGLLKLVETSNKEGGLEVLRLRSLVESMQKGNVTLLPADLSAIASATATVKGLIQGKSS